MRASIVPARARLLALALCLLLGACAAIGPPAIQLSRSQLAQRAFIDRQQVDLRSILKGMEGLELSGPDVGVQLEAARLKFGWTAKFAEAPMGFPLSVYVALSGKPVLNAAGMAWTSPMHASRRCACRIGALRLARRALARPVGRILRYVALLAFRPDELNRDGVIYQARQLSVGAFGLRVDLVPK